MGPPVIELALILIIVLSTYVLFIFTWRYLQRRHIVGYHALPDLLDHSAHALGMIAMALLMIGAVASIGPLLGYVIAFALLAVVFLICLIVRWHSCDRRAESWHVFVNGSMAYMFSFTNVAAATVALLVIYLAFMIATVRDSRRRTSSESSTREDRRSLRTLGSNGDLTIAFSMMLMLTLTQWPQLFG
ncbi:MAG TPA: DUF5134 domain-containing protein [Candidatus Saccharimonadales bacterium]|nr:DUF5134 domain-containing protein [Candidatus Saccharimonadales bacterium]